MGDGLHKLRARNRGTILADRFERRDFRREPNLKNWLLKRWNIFLDLKEIIEAEEFGPLGLRNELFLALERAYQEQPINQNRIGV